MFGGFRSLCNLYLGEGNADFESLVVVLYISLATIADLKTSQIFLINNLIKTHITIE